MHVVRPLPHDVVAGGMSHRRRLGGHGLVRQSLWLRSCSARAGSELPRSPSRNRLKRGLSNASSIDLAVFRDQNGPNGDALMPREAMFDAPPGLFRRFLQDRLCVTTCRTPSTVLVSRSQRIVKTLRAGREAPRIEATQHASAK